jgi:hypothetical protein
MNLDKELKTGTKHSSIKKNSIMPWNFYSNWQPKTNPVVDFRLPIRHKCALMQLILCKS